MTHIKRGNEHPEERSSLKERIAALRALEAKATQGPWRRATMTTRGGFTFGENEILAINQRKWAGSDRTAIVVGWNGFDSADGTKAQRRGNARYIVALRNDALCIIAALEQRALALEGALKQAVTLIKAWHNMPGVRKDLLTDEQTEQMWQIYYNHSPEMKLIREARAALDGGK